MSLIRGLQAGFGHPLGAETLAALRDLGVQLVRLDCKGLSDEVTRALVAEVADAGLVPYPIVSTAAQVELLPAGVNCELLNEPDLNGPTPQEYERLVGYVAKKCEALGLHLWAGCVSNFNARGFRYLREAHVERWPAGVNVSIHFYPHGDSNRTPHPGFDSRQHEVEELKKVIGTRAWGVSEFGFHQAARSRSWIDRLLRIPNYPWTDAQVAEMVDLEWDFWARVGAVGAVLYQINDGPSSTSARPQALDTFGIRRLDGSFKPVASTFRRQIDG